MSKPARDIAAEQALVCEKWKLVHANVKLDGALTAFLTQSLDQCGITITQLAFELVQQVLNPKGYVRHDHKSELSNIGAIVRNRSSAWSEQGKNIATRWDFGDAWMGRSAQWHTDKEDKYKLLKLKAVEDFCELPKKKDKSNKYETLDRNETAQYVKDQHPDKKFALPVLDQKQTRVECLKGLPDMPVTRWETRCSTLDNKAMLTKYDTGLETDNCQDHKGRTRQGLGSKQWEWCARIWCGRLRRSECQS